MAQVSILILAAGKGERAGFNQNKMLAPLHGQPLLYHTLNAVRYAHGDWQIILVCNPTEREELTPYADHFDCLLVDGGATRFESVYNGLQVATEEITLIHDGARPYITEQILDDCVQSVVDFNSGICAIPATDTTVLCQNGEISTPLKRSEVYRLQTPQGFYTKDILSAYEQGKSTPQAFTDDSSVYGKFIRPAHIFMGDRRNVKLTFAEDFEDDFRPPVIEGKLVGIGIDTHTFGKQQDYITLGGVHIPHTCGLIAHSDGDVVYHALADAMLSAIGLRDIGYFFPDTAKETENMDSSLIVKNVMKYLNDMYYCVTGITITIQAERPKIGKHIEAMKQNIHALTKVPLNAIGISAGTNEGLGYVGQGLGITVHACVTID